jgi:hypothetical protein
LNRPVCNRTIKCIGIGLLALGPLGCAGSTPPEPQNLPVPALPPSQSQGSRIIYPADAVKPLPQDSQEPPPPAFDDPPLVDQQLPEESWFVSAYNGVGRPRIAIFVNRTLDGAVIGEGAQPVARTETVRTATTGVDVQSSGAVVSGNYYSAQGVGASDSFKTNGAGEYHETTSVYLQPGQYDDASLSALDYTEIESLLSGWMQAGGQVTLISPDYLRSHLSADQLSDLQAGKASGLDQVGKSTGADVLIQVQAHPAKRGDQFIVLLVGEAINVQGGELLANASVEMPTPVDRASLNNYTRFLTRKLMHGMVGTWTSAPPPAQAPQAAPPPVQPAAPPSTRP